MCLQVTTEQFWSYLHSTSSWLSLEKFRISVSFLGEQIYLQHCDCFLKILQRCFHLIYMSYVLLVYLYVNIEETTHPFNGTHLRSHYALEGIQITNYLTVEEKAIEGKTIRPNISSSCLYLRWLFHQGVKNNAIFVIFDFNNCKNEPLSCAVTLVVQPVGQCAVVLCRVNIKHASVSFPRCTRARCCYGSLLTFCL